MGGIVHKHYFTSMIVFIIYFSGILADKAKSNAPIATDLNRPGALTLTA